MRVDPLVDFVKIDCVYCGDANSYNVLPCLSVLHIIQANARFQSPMTMIACTHVNEEHPYTHTKTYTHTQTCEYLLEGNKYHSSSKHESRDNSSATARPCSAHAHTHTCAGDSVKIHDELILT